MRKILSLLILSFVFLASCELNKQDYYLAASTDSFNHNLNYSCVFFNKNNKQLSASEKISYNTSIKIKWNLIPLCTKTLTYKFDMDGNEAVDSDIHIIIEPDSILKIKPQKNKNATYIELYPVDTGDVSIIVSNSLYGSSTIKIKSILIE